MFFLKIDVFKIDLNLKRTIAKMRSLQVFTKMPSLQVFTKMPPPQESKGNYPYNIQDDLDSNPLARASISCRLPTEPLHSISCSESRILLQILVFTFPPRNPHFLQLEDQGFALNFHNFVRGSPPGKPENFKIQGGTPNKIVKVQAEPLIL